ncbi:hypothetical protein [Ruminococcus albus]|uniref:Uncharacterized protein n=1 Tax=Ruminococcus albus TaxID=1264 RepID=A0A1H7H1T4_RUMAL|nr:hypothetical protein [Ruminococcus albus]SEK44376.1 hypothetical protein SAMN05216469_102360 [Ruminococcus albus]
MRIIRTSDSIGAGNTKLYDRMLSYFFARELFARAHHRTATATADAVVVIR